MNWYIFACISIVSITIANLFQKLAMKKDDSDPVTSSIVFQLLLALTSGIFALTNGLVMPARELFFPYFFISAVLYGLGTLAFFKAVKLIEISQVTIMTGFGAIVTIISAYIFIGEKLTFPQLFGALLILCAIILVNIKKRTITFNKGSLLALIGTACYGLAVTNDAFILRAYSAISYTPIMSLMPGLFLMILFPQKTKELVMYARHKINTHLITYSFLYAIQAIAYYLALENGALASQMNSIFKFEIITTVIVASVFLKERDSLLKKIVAAGIGIVGVLLLK